MRDANYKSRARILAGANVTPRCAIDCCIYQLLEADNKHYLFDKVGGDCTYLELIQALLLAEKALKRHKARFRTGADIKEAKRMAARYGRRTK